MKSTRLLLVRHGETNYNRYHIIQGTQDIPLNEIGRKQAYDLSLKLEEIPIRAAYSSCLERAYETAQIIVKPHRLSVKRYSELNEMHFGNFEGKMYEKVKESWDAVPRAWHNGEINRGFENGENPLQVLERANARLQSIIRKHPGETVLVVTHGRLMRILLSDWFGMGLTCMEEIPIPNTVVYSLMIHGDRIKPMVINDTDHIQKILRPGQQQ